MWVGVCVDIYRLRRCAQKWVFGGVEGLELCGAWRCVCLCVWTSVWSRVVCVKVCLYYGKKQGSLMELHLH